MTETNLFRIERIAAGLSMGQVADAMGITRQAISLWETGEAWPAPKHIPVLAKLFNQKATDFARKVEEYRAALSGRREKQPA